jgi:beta-D-xylosidase 4
MTELTRYAETPGEDPYHLSSYVHALIKGLQGDASDPYKRVVATCKHFAGKSIKRTRWQAQTLTR